MISLTAVIPKVDMLKDLGSMLNEAVAKSRLYVRGSDHHWSNPNDELMIVNELVGTTWMSERRKESQNYGGKVNQTYSSKSDLASFYS